jgi:hypothetical protein
MKAFLVALLILATPAWADEPKALPLPTAEEPHVAALGLSDTTCLEWTDACQVCIRKTPTDEIQCSTPGIACVAEKPFCRRR